MAQDTSTSRHDDTTRQHYETLAAEAAASAEDTSYNGWSNYQTWAVALWLDNEEGSYNYVREMARDAYECAAETTYATRGEVAAFRLAEALRDEHEGAAEDLNPDARASVFSDLLSSALGLVDWHEIGHSLITEVLSEGVGA